MSNTLKLGNGQWATGKDTLLSFSDTNNNYKPLPFSFSRNSSATVVNKNGLIETVGSGEPRIDFKDNTKGALLLEPQRTNYVLKSNDFSLLSGGFVTPNYGTSPEGLSVSRILFTDANQSMSSGTSLSTGVVCNFSAYVKGIKGQFIKFAAGGVDIAHTFSGEWERLSGSATSINNSWNLNTYGYATARDFLLCGVQLEQGSYATSYIPTSGQANGVTRVADVCSNGANDQVINSTEGVLYFEGNSIANDGTFKRISIGTSDNVFANSIQLRYNAVDNSITYQFRVGNVYQADLTITANTTNVNKIACVWKINRFEIWVNGVKQAEDTSGSVPSSNTFNSLFFGKSSNALLEPFKGNIKDIKLYDTALTDQELIALTTI